jgi:hypothetical protein
MAVLLAEIAQQIRNKGVGVAIVFIPTVYQYDPQSHDKSNPSVVAGIRIKDHWLYGKSEIQKRLETWAAAKRLPFLDLTPVFRDATRIYADLTYELDGHWTPTGHQVAAKAIARWLMDNNVFSGIVPEKRPEYVLRAEYQ